ncbi:MAG: helix-turn-helix transcriptional regulator, partial [Roseburia sp.]|nr:helix-turn-helix transcriptional regulator [Roseburia sp.]
FCEDAGISFNTYQNYEAGSRVPTVEILVKIANFYGVTTDYLLGRDSQKSNELTPTQREEIATQKWLSLDKEKRDALLQMMETCIKTFEAAESNHKKIREQEQTIKQSTTLGTLDDQMEEAAKTKEEASS